jgi:hypothetical protein
MNGLYNPWVWMAVAGVVAVWAVVAVWIRRWGPGQVGHLVDCPEKNQKARIVVLQKEAAWGTFRAADVTACSLFSGAVTCEKRCLARL